MCATSPQSPLSVAQGAITRTFAGTILGGAAGSALHAALASPSGAVIDGTLNLVDISGGLLLGSLLGGLWAVESLLLGSGMITATIRAAVSVVGEDRDRQAGDRLLTDVRISLEKLQAVQGPQGFLMRSALYWGGVTSDPGVEKLAEAAEAARLGDRKAAASQQSLSDVLGAVIGATLEARLFELRAALVVFGALLIGGIDAALLFIDSLGS